MLGCVESWILARALRSIVRVLSFLVVCGRSAAAVGMCSDTVFALDFSQGYSPFCLGTDVEHIPRVLESDWSVSYGEELIYLFAFAFKLLNDFADVVCTFLHLNSPFFYSSTRLTSAIVSLCVSSLSPQPPLRQTHSLHKSTLHLIILSLTCSSLLAPRSSLLVTTKQSTSSITSVRLRLLAASPPSTWRISTIKTTLLRLASI
jgi:hypothetical protein